MKKCFIAYLLTLLVNRFFLVRFQTSHARSSFTHHVEIELYTCCAGSKGRVTSLDHGGHRKIFKISLNKLVENVSGYSKTPYSIPHTTGLMLYSPCVELALPIVDPRRKMGQH